MSALLSLIERFPQLRVLVIGEAMLDRYLYGCATRLCQETPVPVVTLSHSLDQPGGAANTAVNLQSLGAQVTLMSVIGRDWEGDRVRQILGEQNIQTQEMLATPQRTTLTKQRVIDGDRLVLRFDQGSTDAIAPDLETRLIRHLTATWKNFDAIVVSDYGYGILTPRLIETLARLQAQSPNTLVVDAKDLTVYRSLEATAMKPNYQQTLNLLNQSEFLEIESRSRYIESQASRILEATKAKIVAVTLDSEGAIVLQPDHAPYRLYANPACPTRTIGAGDTFTAAFTLALAANAQAAIAADLAAAAAAIVVNKTGTATCTASDLKTAFLTPLPHP